MLKDLVLDLFFPKKCIQCKKLGNFICANCFAQISFDVGLICPLCNRGSITGRTHENCKKRYSIDGLIPCVSYRPIVRKMTYQLKYRPYVSQLSATMGEIMIEALEQSEMFYKILSQKPLLLPVPLYQSKLRKRGYNHAALLGSHVAQYYGSKFDDQILHRIRDTKPQFKLDRSSRMLNVKDAFDISKRKKELIKNKTIVVVDDIATTCSTLAECAKLLKRNGAKEVWGVVFTREGR